MLNRPLPEKVTLLDDDIEDDSGEVHHRRLFSLYSLFTLLAHIYTPFMAHSWQLLPAFYFYST